jgi:hypothetical protein
MPLHDHVSSVLALARNVRDSIDPSKTHTLVQNESLKLLMNTLIELGTPGQNKKLAESAAKTVAGMIAPPILNNSEVKRDGWI